MIDNRTNEPTEAQVEAAARAIADSLFSRWTLTSRVRASKDRGSLIHVAARAALEAAAGVAPQAESEAGKRLSSEFRADLVEAARERIQAVWADVPEGVDAKTLAQNVVSAQEFFWLSLHFPVQPSSTVDVATLIREAKAEAWDEGVATALNYAKRQPDGITLKLETFGGDGWPNPYREGSET